MAKNKSVKSKGHNDVLIAFPEKRTFDELAVIDDDTLVNVHRSLLDSISRANSHSLNPEAWEVELCYVQREMQIRTARHEAHAKYLSTVVPVEAD